METARSDTMRTARSGCLDLTLADRSCTQMEIDIRCAILTSNVANSRMPEGVCVSSSPVPPVPFSVFRTFASSRRTALNDEGIAASTTESASTMAMSSSSERCDSFAASSSSVAMPKETENARSEPSEPSAPAVLMPPPPVPPLQNVATSHDVRIFSNEGDTIPHLLAWQTGFCLSIRRLLLSPILETGTPGRGGKALKRVRVGSTHHHGYSGCVFGCLLGNLIQFAKGTSNLRTSEAILHLRKCLEPAGKDMLSCTGADAAHLHRGFACYNVIRGQLPLLSESQTSPRIDAKYGKKSVAIGIAAAIYYLFSVCQRVASNSNAVRMSTEYFVERCFKSLQNWRELHGNCPACHSAAMEAEKRALRRGLLAIRVAKKMTRKEGIDDYKALQFELEFMRKAMWPQGKEVSSATQADLCEWIHTDEFTQSSTPETHERPRPVDCTLPIPLSQLSELPPRDTGGAMEDDVSSVDGSASVASSYPSTVSSTGELREEGGAAVEALSSFLLRV